MCLDRKNPGQGSLHVYNCWDGWNQKWIWNKETGLIWIQVEDEIEYLSVIAENTVASFPKMGSKWEIVNKTLDGVLIKLLEDYLCITVDHREIILQRCDHMEINQRWKIERNS